MNDQVKKIRDEIRGREPEEETHTLREWQQILAERPDLMAEFEKMTPAQPIEGSIAPKIDKENGESFTYSEELEEEVTRYCKEEFFYNADFDAWQTSERHPCIIREDMIEIARHFAEWQKRKDDEKLSDMLAVAHLQQKKQHEKDLTDKIAAEYQLGLANMKKMMMENAITCKVEWFDGPLLNFTQQQHDAALERIEAKVGDTIKLIILKDDESK